MQPESNIPPLSLPPAWPDGDEGDDGIEGDIGAFKALVAQRDAHAQRFRRLKDRLLGREPGAPDP